MPRQAARKQALKKTWSHTRCFGQLLGMPAMFLKPPLYEQNRTEPTSKSNRTEPMKIHTGAALPKNETLTVWSGSVKTYFYQNSDKFIVPSKHYFFLGDNRDCSKDSRFLSSVGYVHEDNLIGKAEFIFFSSDYRIGSIFKFWKWPKTIRFNRFFKKIN